MRVVRRCLLIALLVLSIGAVAAKANAANFRPTALRAVVELAEATVDEGKVPVAIFDLDDTLINTRERTLRIIHDFTSNKSVQRHYFTEVLALQHLNTQDIRFSLDDTLKAEGITNPAFIKAADNFWLKRFFTNQYCANDKPNPGAVRYVQNLARIGTKIIYLTGRDVPRMHDGTAQDLEKLGFPLDGDQSVLIMKPDTKSTDLAFKISMFQEIGKMGTVVGVFENEPANVNAHHDAFPQAVAIFLDTIHSNAPITPENGIFWVKNFIP